MNLDIQLHAVSRGYDGMTCWVQARGGHIPASHTGSGNSNDRFIVTMQKLLLIGSDVFYAIHTAESDDRGLTWSTPRDEPSFQRINLGEHREVAVCDFTPTWHAQTGVMLGTGHTAFYQHNKIPHGNRPRATPYSIYDPAARQWQPWRELEMPAGEKFSNAGAGCTQRVDLDDGRILLPIYFRVGDPYKLAATVVECDFDGKTMTYRRHGDEVTTAGARGVAEPSLATCNGRYFLTLRSDETGWITASDDGLHYGPLRPWTFDDGSPLGNYNTQQHWVTRAGKLYLVYTRRGLNNDHVFRHRAPLLIAEVNQRDLTVIRSTERVVVPERGARIGNFGVVPVSDDETWIVAAEWMQPRGCDRWGSDNTVWAARLAWQ